VLYCFFLLWCPVFVGLLIPVVLSYIYFLFVALGFFYNNGSLSCVSYYHFIFLIFRSLLPLFFLIYLLLDFVSSCWFLYFLFVEIIPFHVTIVLGFCAVKYILGSLLLIVFLLVPWRFINSEVKYSQLSPLTLIMFLFCCFLVLCSDISDRFRLLVFSGLFMFLLIFSDPLIFSSLLIFSIEGDVLFGGRFIFPYLLLNVCFVCTSKLYLFLYFLLFILCPCFIFIPSFVLYVFVFYFVLSTHWDAASNLQSLVNISYEDFIWYDGIGYVLSLILDWYCALPLLRFVGFDLT